MVNCIIKPFSFSSGVVPTKFQSISGQTQAVEWCDLLQIGSNIIGLLYNVIIPLAILMVAWGGFTLLTAAGNEKRMKQGKMIIKSAIIGVAIAFGAGLLIGTILKGIGVSASIIPWL